jgi:glycosyltransferase involved in cell wall biosynthesis
MRVGIDASNLRSGGSLTHIGELLSAAQPEKYGVTHVVIWGGSEVLSRLPSRPWLETVYHAALDKPLPVRVLWQQTKLSALARHAACDLLFVPGGTYLGDFRPYVTMSHNLLPFDSSQVRLYGLSPMALKFFLLRVSQSATVRKAGGTIFLHDYARARVVGAVKTLTGPDVIIPHGVADRFRNAPKRQKALSEYSAESPFKLLYVSTVDAYKHQWRVAEAVAKLVKMGLPLSLELVGPANGGSMQRLAKAVKRLGAEGYVRYRGAVPYGELPPVYADCDAFVFASSCENLPNILLEAMSAGLPIACSNRLPMPKILGGGGVYFDPSDSGDIARALHHLSTSPEARESCASVAYERARHYSWERCADDTFSFLRAAIA